MIARGGGNALLEYMKPTLVHRPSFRARDMCLPFALWFGSSNAWAICGCKPWLLNPGRGCKYDGNLILVACNSPTPQTLITSIGLAKPMMYIVVHPRS